MYVNVVVGIGIGNWGQVGCGYGWVCGGWGKGVLFFFLTWGYFVKYFVDCVREDFGGNYDVWL